MACTPTFSPSPPHARLGAISLDTVAGVNSFDSTLQRVFQNMSATSGLGHDVLSLHMLAPTVAILSTLALTVIFFASPTFIVAAYPSADPSALKQAALVPTACMLVSFVANVGMLVASFLSASRAVGLLRSIHATVLRWHMSTAEVRARYAALRTHLLRRDAASLRADSACDRGLDAAAPAAADVGDHPCGRGTGPHVRARRPGLAWNNDDAGIGVSVESSPPEDEPGILGAITELEAVMDAQRGLLLRLGREIDDSAGIRFLGVFRPGAVSVGSFLVAMASSAALGVRLAVDVYQAQ